MPVKKSIKHLAGVGLAFALFAATFALSVIAVSRLGTVTNDKGGGRGSLGPFENLNCTFTQGFWKNRPEARPDNGTVVIGTGNYTSEEVTELMRTPASEQHRVVSHLIAALFNIASGTSSTAEVDTTISALDASIGKRNLLFVDLRTVVSVVVLNAFSEILADYNEGVTGPGKCDDDDDCPPCPTETETGTSTFTCPTEVTCTNALSVCDFQPPKADRLKVEFCNGNDTTFFVSWIPAGTVVNGTVWTATFNVTRFGDFVETLVSGPFELEYRFQRPIGDFNSSATEFAVEVVASVQGCTGSGPVTKKGPIDLLEPFEQLAKAIRGQ